MNLYFDSEKQRAYTIIVGTGSSEQEIIQSKLTLSAITEKIPQGSLVRIINFASKFEIVSEFKNDISKLEAEIKELKLIPGEGINLKPAIENAYQGIKLFPGSVKHKVILLLSGIPIDDSLLEINSMEKSGIEFYVFGSKEVLTKENIIKLLPYQVSNIFNGLSELIQCIGQTIKEIPLELNFYATNQSKIQKSSEPFSVTVEMTPTLNTSSFEVGQVKFKVLPNEYYHGYEVVVNKKIDDCNTFTSEIVLRVKNNSTSKLISPIIQFELVAKGETITGHFNLDLTFFCGDFIITGNELINIMVEGEMGIGKSSLLNLVYNLFTSKQEIDRRFFSSKGTNHITTCIDYNPISNLLANKFGDDALPVYSDIIDKVNIVLVDKPGMTPTDTNINYELASKGCYPPGTSRESMLPASPNPVFAISAFLFVVSLASFLGEDSEIDMIRRRMLECIEKSKIQPTLAITFSDNFTAGELEKSKKQIEKLPVEKENIFFVQSYIDNNTKRNIKNDLTGWALMKKTFETAKKSIEQSRIKSSNNDFYNSKCLNVKNTTRTIATHNNSPTSQQPSSCFGNSNLPIGDENDVPSSSQQSPSLNKPWVITVIMNDGCEDQKEIKFKVSKKLSILELKTQVATNFNLSNSQFNLVDEDSCRISISSSIEEILSDGAKLLISC